MDTFAGKHRKHLATAGRIRPNRSQVLATPGSAQQNLIRNILRPAAVLAKRSISQPNDRYEREADQISDHVIRQTNSDLVQSLQSERPAPLEIQRLDSQYAHKLSQRNLLTDDDRPEENPDSIEQRMKLEGITDEKLLDADEAEPGKARDHKKRLPDAGHNIQTKPANAQPPLLTRSIESAIDQFQSGGEPLDSTSRAFFEPRFGHDFSAVRVHTDGHAAKTASAIHARAFTLGNHVVMGAGEFQPATQSGRKLLAHELTHTIQQGAASPVQASSALVQREVLDAALGMIGDLVSDPFAVTDPVELVFDNVVATNRAISSRIDIPENWYTIVAEFASDHPADGAILISALIRRPSFYEGGWIMDLQPDASAMTLDRSIFIPTGSTLTLQTFVHELVHVTQYQQLGVTPFLVSYFGMSAATIVYRWLNGEAVEVMQSSPHEDQAYNLATRFTDWYNRR